MTKKEYENWKEHILSYMSLDDIRANIKGLDYTRGNTYTKALKMVQAGFFACYYKFDESIYFTKKNEWKWRNGECYVWTIYKAKVALTINKMLND